MWAFVSIFDFLEIILKGLLKKKSSDENATGRLVFKNSYVKIIIDHGVMVFTTVIFILLPSSFKALLTDIKAS